MIGSRVLPFGSHVRHKTVLLSCLLVVTGILLMHGVTVIGSGHMPMKASATSLAAASMPNVDTSNADPTVGTGATGVHSDDPCLGMLRPTSSMTAAPTATTARDELPAAPSRPFFDPPLTGPRVEALCVLRH